MFTEILKQIGLDETILTQLVIFVVFFLWMRTMFFGPFLKLIQMRESKTQGSLGDAEALEQKAEAQEVEYAQKIAEIKKEASAEREKILSAARQKSAATVEQARKEAKQVIEKARARSATERDVELKYLKDSVPAFANTLVGKLTKERVRLT